MHHASYATFCCVCCVLKTYLFDVGEGTLRQISSTRIKFNTINKIFITHLHGDHIFGLPTIVIAMQTAIKVSRTAANASQPEDVIPLEIFGPVGIYSYLGTCMVHAHVLGGRMLFLDEGVVTAVSSMFVCCCVLLLRYRLNAIKSSLAYLHIIALSNNSCIACHYWG